MKRRTFVNKAVLGAAAGSMLMGCGREAASEQSGPAILTGEEVEWHLLSSFAGTLEILPGTAEKFSNRVSTLTGGHFTIRISTADGDRNGGNVFESVRKGNAEMGYASSHHFINSSPALAFDTGVPFGLTARQHHAWFLYGGGQQLLRDLFADFDLVNLSGGYTGTRMGGWFLRDINWVSDFQDLKIYIPGLGAEVMTRLGASVTDLDPKELVQALEQGRLDAAEWSGPYEDLKLGLNKAANIYYYPGWWQPSGAVSFYINRNAWENLPSNYREIVSLAANECATSLLAEYDSRNAEAFKTLVESGIQARPFPQDVLTTARLESEALLEQYAGSDDTFRRIHSSYAGFRDIANPWFGTAEQTFASFAFGSTAEMAASEGECSI